MRVSSNKMSAVLPSVVEKSNGGKYSLGQMMEGVYQIVCGGVAGGGIAETLILFFSLPDIDLSRVIGISVGLLAVSLWKIKGALTSK